MLVLQIKLITGVVYTFLQNVAKVTPACRTKSLIIIVNYGLMVTTCRHRVIVYRRAFKEMDWIVGKSYCTRNKS